MLLALDRCDTSTVDWSSILYHSFSASWSCTEPQYGVIQGGEAGEGLRTHLVRCHPPGKWIAGGIALLSGCSQ